MWESMISGMAAATFWDWFWHILAVGGCVVASVPQLWWPFMSKFFKNKEENPQDEHAQLHSEK